MMVVTGAAGFVGSCLISRLNKEGFNYIIAVDDFTSEVKQKNLEGKKIKQYVNRDNFFRWLDKNHEEVEFIFHIGARTDTTESDGSIFERLNLNYSKILWKACCEYQIPLIYASAAATYGVGDLGYDDNEDTIPQLKPISPYGDSKNEFDKWALKQKEKPFFWAGLKFFNVYGPNEYHKGKMASVIFQAFHQISNTGGTKLFRSHNPEYKDGEQKRDFIYVKDLIDVIIFLMRHRKDSGIYNVGTGKARTFLDLAKAIFQAMNTTSNIDFINMPKGVKDKYQYFTEANIQKLRSIGYDKPFTSLENGIKEYIEEYLLDRRYY